MSTLHEMIRCFALAMFAFQSSSVFGEPTLKTSPSNQSENLPEHAIARLGSTHFRHGGPITAL